MAAPNPVAHADGLITELSVDIAICITSGERELSLDARVIGGDGGRDWPENIGLMAHMVRAGLRLPASLAQFQGVCCEHMQGGGIPCACVRFCMKWGRPAHEVRQWAWK